MKRYFLMLCLALMSASTFAQKGSTWIGGDVRYNTSEFKNFGVDAKVQWQCLKVLRLEAAAGYLFENNDYKRLDGKVNAHLLLNLGKENFNIYPIGGVIVAHETTKALHFKDNGNGTTKYYSDETNDCFDIILGAGIEYPISKNVKVNAEYQYIYLDKGELSLGVAFRL